MPGTQISPLSARLSADELGCTGADQGGVRSVDAAYQVLRVCVFVSEGSCLSAHPCRVSGENSPIQQYSAGYIRGAISGTMLSLISLLIILLTYCTAVCLVDLKKSYCKLRTSLYTCLLSFFSLQAPSVSLALFTLFKPWKALALSLHNRGFYNLYLSRQI